MECPCVAVSPRAEAGALLDPTQASNSEIVPKQQSHPQTTLTLHIPVLHTDRTLRRRPGPVLQPGWRVCAFCMDALAFAGLRKILLTVLCLAIPVWAEQHPLSLGRQQEASSTLPSRPLVGKFLHVSRVT